MSDNKQRWTPRTTVAAIVERDGKFLMVEEMIQGQLMINQPAGHLEENERFLDAVKREALEETRWIIEPTAFLGLYVYLNQDRTLTFHRACFVATAIEERQEAKLDPVIIRTRWMTRNEVAENLAQLRSDLVLKCIDDYLSGVRYPLDIIQDQAVISQQ